MKKILSLMLALTMVSTIVMTLFVESAAFRNGGENAEIGYAGVRNIHRAEASVDSAVLSVCCDKSADTVCCLRFNATCCVTAGNGFVG